MEQVGGTPQQGTEALYDYEEDIDRQVAEKVADIDAYNDSHNYAEDLDEDTLEEIGQRVVSDYERDYKTMESWRSDLKNWIGLATLLREGKKDFPFNNASNAKYPLLAMAAVQFSARTYPIVVQNGSVAKSKIVGEDRDGSKAFIGKCIDTHMNYQLMDEMEEWEENEDTSLAVLPIAGCTIKKTFYGGKALGRHKSVFVPAENLVLNYYSSSFNTCPRITEITELTKNDYIEMVNSDIFLDIGELGPPVNIKEDEKPNDDGDPDAPHTFLEQHRLWDLDDDGYQEPYIVTVHKATTKVVRIKANWDQEGEVRNAKDKIVKITPNKFYTQRIFMPSPDGGCMGMGFGKLLGGINDVVDSTINQLLDAGTRANTQGGFIGNDAHPNGGQGGVLTFQPGEYKPVDYSGDDIRKAIVPLQFQQPSNVLFSLLGLMIEAGKELSSVTEALTGGESPTNEPATTRLSRVEQGLKVFSAIQKRVYRSLKEELRKIHRLNRIYLDEEVVYRVNDIEHKVERRFYENKSLDVMPVADPNEVSDTQKRFKAEALMSLKGQGMNDKEIDRRFLEALGVDEPEAILNAPDTGPPPELMLKIRELELKEKEYDLKLMRFGYEMMEIQTRAIKNIAEAEAKEMGPQLEQYKAEMTQMTQMMTQKMQAQQTAGANTGNSQNS